ncbi:hypothetical protein GCM10023085_37770 [Actinomadura viridis]|uniref:DUF397 domain-containing protein n=1 Tax=Actinomadura viridis TaxID=58110 RepID=A0A931DFI7_9ACTN|nr:DUF397 domain-containing protein [Actinomadura viridis]MBG6087688.1 hypothetical protein [Actinomadura viridis]
MTKHFTGWRKSRHSDPNGGCVEAGRAADGTIGVRDSKGDLSIMLEFAPKDWATFLNSLRETRA